MDLAERHTQLAELNAALRDARSGQGSVVLVTGEAGAGKTALVRRFAADVSAESRILWGLCDELATPRPLGPFRDMATQMGVVRESVSDDSGSDLVEALLRELGRSPRGTVAVVEDAHWADEATIDAIRFVGRRIRRLPALLVVTFRGAEVSADHPLRLAVAAVPPDDIRRIALLPLSVDGVAKLAGRRDVAGLYELTGGNPFYVTEVLAAPEVEVPDTVQDAVMARVGRLSGPGLATVRTAAVMPGRAEVSVLEACDVADGLDDAVRSGVVSLDGGEARFAHELTRRAVETQLTPSQRVEINKRVLSVLEGMDADPARLTHHAVEADDAAAVARFAPLAACNAARLDSHREAAAQFRRALDHQEAYADDEAASLWFEYARECNVTGRHRDTEEALGRAVELFDELGDDERLGASLSLLSEALWFTGRGAEAREALDRAATLLEDREPGPALAWTYAQRARLALVDWRGPEAVEWGEKAIDLGRRLGETMVQAHALNTTGTARWIMDSGDDDIVQESLRFSLENGLNAQVARAYANLVSGYLTHLDYAHAERYLDEGIAFCAEHDMLSAQTWMQAQQAEFNLEQGQWAAAEEIAERALEASGAHNIAALLVLGTLHARRGTALAEPTLAEARTLANRVGDAQNLVPVTVARVEWAWLNGVLPDLADNAAELRDFVVATDSPTLARSSVWLWLHRAGVLTELPDGVFEPYADQIRGDWRRAAKGWAEVGRPYARADALADADEPSALLEALEILDRLGAKPRAAMVRSRLAELGLTSIPRGPHSSTRANPAGLTRRQAEVLYLLAEDLTYQEIAERLYLSVKTVDHHVAAVRAKLEVGTRDEAVATARRLGMLRPPAT